MSKPAHFKFRLYVAGNGPSSAQAIVNLEALCREYLPQQYEIEVVDILGDPRRALLDGVILTPLLVKLLPAPKHKIVGSLSQRELVLQELGIPPLTQ